MNEIIIIYGSFEDKKVVIEPDSLMLYTDSISKKISEEQLSLLFSVLCHLKNEKVFKKFLDRNYYNVLVHMNGSASEYSGIIDNDSSFNQVLDWLGDLNVR